jgi:hypothetical protein
MTMKNGSDLRFEPGSWTEAGHDVYIGLVVGMGHVVKIFFYAPYYCLFGSKVSIPLLPPGNLKVVGVGFGRTGTVGLPSFLLLLFCCCCLLVVVTPLLLRTLSI